MAWKSFCVTGLFVTGIHQSPVGSPPKGPVTRSFDISFVVSLIRDVTTLFLYMMSSLCPLGISTNLFNQNYLQIFDVRRTKP